MVTGAGGYIGSVATYLFLQNGFEVVAIDNFSTGHKQPLEVLQEKFGKDRLRFYDADLHSTIQKVFELEQGIKAVVHYAASCLVNESMENPAKYFYNNVHGSLNLLRTMDKYGVKNIVFSSTCAVYGEAEYVPVDEKHPTVPANPYGESKRMVEKIIEWYGALKDVHFMVLRYFNVCGASDDGLIGDSKNPSVLMVQNAVRGAMGIEPFYITCPEVDTPDKTPIRDYINVVDLNEAHLAALDHLFNEGESGFVNLGTGTGNSVLEIVKEIEKVTDFHFDLKKGAERQGEYAKMIADITKAKEVLHWEPKRTLEQTIKSLQTWYTAHPHGWDD